jgi:hypothetical protein
MQGAPPFAARESADIGIRGLSPESDAMVMSPCSIELGEDVYIAGRHTIGVHVHHSTRRKGPQPRRGWRAICSGVLRTVLIPLRSSEQRSLAVMIHQPADDDCREGLARLSSSKS